MKKRFFMLTILISLATLTMCCMKLPQKGSKIIHSSICSDYSKHPISTLPIWAVDSMTDQYRQNQLKHINNGIFKRSIKKGIIPRKFLKNVDAQAIWFDLDSIKKFIYHIEKISTSNDKNITSSMLGIRIYYASYLKDPLKNREIGLSKTNSINYAKKHTLIMIPTIRTKTGTEDINIDFNPQDISTYVNGLKNIKTSTSNSFSIPSTPLSASSIPQSNNINTQYNSNKRIMAFGYQNDVLNNTYGRSTLARNHGGLFPPRKMEGMSFIDE